MDNLYLTQNYFSVFLMLLQLVPLIPLQSDQPYSFICPNFEVKAFMLCQIPKLYLFFNQFRRLSDTNLFVFDILDLIPTNECKNKRLLIMMKIEIIQYIGYDIKCLHRVLILLLLQVVKLGQQTFQLQLNLSLQLN